ncbi:MAG TPA: hypothetical protein VNM48_01505 [Chloroflexota bacterium]|nr:hypothetical protein [Chloroflexota bacterium]
MSHGRGKRIPEHKRRRYTGRGADYSFLRLPHFLLESAEFAALSNAAARLLLDLAKRYRGRNNGDISCPWSRLSKEGWSSENTVRRALHELLAAGFLICTRSPMRKRCGLYAITWEAVDECPGKMLEVRPERVPSQLWRNRNSNGGGKGASPHAA